MKSQELPLYEAPPSSKARSLKDLRGNISLLELSRMAGVAYGLLRGYERGESGITESMAEKIASVLQVPVDHVLPPGASVAPGVGSETVPQRFERLCEEAGLSGVELAYELGVSLSAVAKLKRGEKELSLRLAVAGHRLFSAVLGRPISIEYIACLYDDEGIPGFAASAPVHANVIPMRRGKILASAPVPQAQPDAQDLAIQDLNRRMTEAGKMIVELTGQVLKLQLAVTPKQTSEREQEAPRKQAQKTVHP